MVMITPAEFEDKMKELVKTDNKDEIVKLMCDVLVDNGYESGVKVLLKAREA